MTAVEETRGTGGAPVAREARRWRFVRAALWLVGFGSLCAPVLDDPPLHSGACVQNVGPESAVVAMITRTPEVLAIAVADEQGGEVPVAAQPAPVRRHEFRLAGLQPGRGYRFRILDSGGSERDSGSLRTPPGDDEALVRFAALGDSGGQPWWTWVQRSPLWYLPARMDLLPTSDMVTAIGARVAAAKPDFVVHVGDIVYPWGHAGHYSAGFFRPFADALRNAPFYAVLGNHDVLDDAGRQALANFVLPRNDVTGDERCCSFAWGSVRVTLLDLGQILPRDPAAAAEHPTMRFLREQLAAATEPWQIVVSHYPVFSASRQRDRADLIGALLPALEAAGVDLYLCGHDHTYQRFGRQGHLVQVVTGGGGKSLYDAHPDPRAQVVQSRYHWCAVEVRGRDLVLRARSPEGELLDTVELHKDLADPGTKRLETLNPGRHRRIAALH